jgi:hypothetical protein
MKNLLILTLVLGLVSMAQAGLVIRLYETNGTPYTGRALNPGENLEIRLEAVGGDTGDSMWVLYCDETYGVIGKTGNCLIPPAPDASALFGGAKDNLVDCLGPTEDGIVGTVASFVSFPPYPNGVYFDSIPFTCVATGDVVLRLVDNFMFLCPFPPPMDSVIIHQDGVCSPAPPATLTVPASDADGAYTISWTASSGATSYQLESSAPASGTTIYPLWVQVYSGTVTSYNEKVGGGTWSYQVKATNACGSSAYTNGSNNCVVSDCLKSTATEYAAWKIWRYPRCWCFKRQCRGDINGIKVGVNWVATADLACFKAAYLKNDAVVAAIICSMGTTGTIGGICADLNHAKVGLYRVGPVDLNIFKTYYTKGEAIVRCCDNDGDCVLQPTDKYNFWTN